MNKRSVLTMIKTGFIWWGQGLFAWLPELWVKKLFLRPVIQCVVDGDQVRVHLIDKQGDEQDKLRFNLSSQQDHDSVTTWLTRYKKQNIVLIIPEKERLITNFQMPAQAKDNLDEMLKFEIDRQTPFTLEDVFYGYQLNDDVTESKALSVTLVVVPKQFVTDRVARLAVFSLSINALLISGTAQQPMLITLSGSKQAPNYLFKVNIGLFMFAILLTLMLLYKPVWYYEQQIEAIQATRTELKKQAQHVSQLKKQNASLIKRAQFLNDRLERYRARLAILNKIAEILPQHTWLEFSEFQDHSLILYGQSAAATDLIELLTNTGDFEAVRFIAPLTRDVQSGKDRFRLKAVINPERSSNEI